MKISRRKLYQGKGVNPIKDWLNINSDLKITESVKNELEYMSKNHAKISRNEYNNLSLTMKIVVIKNRK